MFRFWCFKSPPRVQLLLLHFISLRVLSESLHYANLLLTCVVSFWTVGFNRLVLRRLALASRSMFHGVRAGELIWYQLCQCVWPWHSCHASHFASLRACGAMSPADEWRQLASAFGNRRGSRATQLLFVVGWRFHLLALREPRHPPTARFPKHRNHGKCFWT